MRRALERMKQRILKLTKRRVADEHSTGAERDVLDRDLLRRQGTWNWFAVLRRVVEVPVGLLSRVYSGPIHRGWEGTSERDHIMMHDGLRYAVFL
ncbi:hypothetical protein MRB53_010412 [Persea americana]|uniref:Uncharacterized protein n=1 Tax=Persea americana TaxID=3435 RepID=A0ACC2LRZ8_PERAE|nr:hypothetical protein MRB53_010412 [Persea americana]